MKLNRTELNKELDTLNIGDTICLEVYSEICCDVCNDIIHNHIDCPVCNNNYTSTDQYHELYGETILNCECGASFELVKGSWYYDCEVKILTLNK